MTRMIARWDPFRDLASFDRLFRDSLGRAQGNPCCEALEGTGWSPAVDILEKENEIVLRADIPGIDPKDLEIEVQNGTLTLKGERKFESDVKEDDYRRVERVYGSFSRSFTLPRTVDADKVEAACRNGVLELTLPKRPEAKPKQIKVAVK